MFIKLTYISGKPQNYFAMKDTIRCGFLNLGPLEEFSICPNHVGLKKIIEQRQGLVKPEKTDCGQFQQIFNHT